VLGLGSRLRGDDAAGSLVAEGLANRGMQNVFDCGGVPENYVTKIEKIAPTDIVFVDAVDFSEKAGTIELFGGSGFDYQSVSTHSSGLSPLMEYLSRTCDARLWVLAIQPESVDYSATLSEPVREAVRQIVSSSAWPS